jgi:hypothetical protein
MTGLLCGDPETPGFARPAHCTQPADDAFAFRAGRDTLWRQGVGFFYARELGTAPAHLLPRADLPPLATNNSPHFK